VSYRDSKLTRLLQSQLGGNSCTAVICTLSPLKEHVQESLNTLRFGMCAGGVKKEVKINIKTDEQHFIIEEISNSLSSLENEKSQLEIEVELAKEKLESTEANLNEQIEKITTIQENIQEMKRIRQEMKALKEEKARVIQEISESINR